jgi:transposase
VLLPNRRQLELRASDLESLLAEGHRARLVWGYVERQDLSRFYDPIKVRAGGVGRSAIAPEVLFALWLYATLEGVGSARALARLTQEHDAYRWICGGLQVSYHTLSDFRIEHGAALDEVLSENLAALMAVGVVKLKRVAQDGVRVRASAGAASFRREAALQRCLEEAQQQVARLKEALQADPAGASRKQQAACARAAAQRQARIEQALARLPELAEAKRRQGKAAAEARASSTDADATVMKMGDSGFRPAYNTQFASDCASQVIVGVEVVTSGSDQAQLAPMVEQVAQRCAASPEEWLVDGGYPAHQQIEAVSEQTVVYAPVPKPKDPARDAHAPKTNDSDAIVAWRERMGSEAAQAIYKERAATAECVNAQARNRGLVRLPVRGRHKVKCVATLFALAHNLMRMAVLAPALVGLGSGASAVAATAG